MIWGLVRYCKNRALKSMTWCNKFEIHYLFNNVSVSLLSILIPCIILYEYSCLHILHCTWLRCIMSCTEDLSHEFLVNKWLVHSQFMGLGNLLKVAVHHLLIGGMTGLGVDPPPIHRPARLAIKIIICVEKKWFSSFGKSVLDEEQFCLESSLTFYFYFWNEENQVRTKTPQWLQLGKNGLRNSISGSGD